jgi:glycosyltransferase involved in cell wall biosynthesis
MIAMGKSQTLSVTIITINEEHDLPRCLDSVSFADEIIVVDSGSTDKTIEIAKAKGAKVITQSWLGYGAQKNFAASKAKSDWVLNIDADEAVTPELKKEILDVINAPHTTGTTNGFAVARKTRYLGRWIMHGGWYPNYVTRLARKSSSRWSEPEVHEELLVDGPIEKLKYPLLHYTFHDIEDQVRTNLKYARQGALELAKRGKRPGLGHLIFKPIGKFLETYVGKRGFLDGLAGFIISINAAHSMFLKYAYFIEESRELNSHEEKDSDHRQ